MNLDQIIAALRNKIADNKSRQVIKDLRDLLTNDSGHKKTLMLLSSKYNRISDLLIGDLERRSDLETEFNKINDGLWDLISRLENEDFIPNPKLNSYGIINPLLILCFDVNQKGELEAFFNQFDFQSIRIELAENYNEAWNETADLTIWDNRDLPPCPSKEFLESKNLKESERSLILKRLSFLDTCLDKKPSPHFIHFGEQFFFVNEHRNCVNAANSFFSLYARIRETLDFINTYRA